MDLIAPVTALSERLGDQNAGAVLGLVTGLVFGLAAQRSAFCLRSAAIEFGRWQLGGRMAIWLLTFSTAMVWVQGAEMAGLFQPESARIMAVTGSWSGAIIGGLIFGWGMVMARGCSGRLLVLAGTGNLRSITAGLVFALSAQLTLSGLLSPVREAVAGLWVTPGGQNINLMDALGLPRWSGMVVGLGFAAVALWLARRSRTAITTLVWACGVGFAVALGWVLTFTMSQVSFDPVAVSSATFAGPSAHTLMAILQPFLGFDFEIGLILGVFLGALAGASMGHEVHLQSYTDPLQMIRSVIGGALMGFGGMLAGGCAIGAGLTGTSIFNATLWLATICFFIGAWAADRVFDRRAAAAQAPVAVQH